MKTIKALLKELFEKRSKESPPVLAETKPSAPPEAKTSEQPDSKVDSNDSTETDSPTNTENNNLKTEKSQEDSNNNQNTKNQTHTKTNNYETETDESAGDSLLDPADTGQSDRIVEEARREAYRRGVIDGRNQRIEEIYFRKVEDGVPHFNGDMSKSRSKSNIFSMAREA